MRNHLMVAFPRPAKAAQDTERLRFALRLGLSERATRRRNGSALDGRAHTATLDFGCSVDLGHHRLRFHPRHAPARHAEPSEYGGRPADRPPPWRQQTR